MPRRSSGGRSARSRARSRSPARKPVKRAPPPAHVQVKSRGSTGIGSTIAEGMAFGTGNAVAHRAVDAVMGPRTIRHETVAAPPDVGPPEVIIPVVGPPEVTVANISYSDACGMHAKAFQDCIKSSGSDISKCQFYMDMLTECRKGSGLSA
ncbi:uncharacterized protein [Rutidosis leptorrhynchoides]|uniref:uncharacterized protein n=1 Tax=Rutidosis leptorrhynchoides TaxID=125765 RepID=UPI003A991B1C